MAVGATCYWADQSVGWYSDPSLFHPEVIRFISRLNGLEMYAYDGEPVSNVWDRWPERGERLDSSETQIMMWIATVSLTNERPITTKRPDWKYKNPD